MTLPKSHNSVHVLGTLAKDPEVEDGFFVLTVDTTRLEGLSRLGAKGRVVTDRLRVVVRDSHLNASAASLKRGHRLFVDGRLESSMRLDVTGHAQHVVAIVATRLEAFRDGVRQDVFNALRRKQQRDREAEAFIGVLATKLQRQGDKAPDRH